MSAKCKIVKTPELVEQAKLMVKAGTSKRQIARHFGIDKTTVQRWLCPLDKEGRTKYNRTRQNLRNKKYRTDPLYRIRQLLRVAKAKADREGYAACSSSPEEILNVLTDKCECCYRHESICGTLCLDHWHALPAKFRAWLCHDCNRAIGLLQDDITILENAINLLKTRKNDAKA